MHLPISTDTQNTPYSDSRYKNFQLSASPKSGCTFLLYYYARYNVETHCLCLPTGNILLPEQEYFPVCNHFKTR
jgi:hypothetical protein